jgi:hypothetical protein
MEVLMKASSFRLAILAAFGLLFIFPLPARAAEPCSLLTLQEIVQVLGNPVTANPLGTTGCMWKGTPQYVSVVVRPASSWSRIILPVQGVTKTDVGGIGDAASLSGMQNIWTLSVKQGSNVLVITVYNTKPPDQQKTSEQSLAKLALKRL